VAELLERNVVIELEDIGNDEDKAFLIGTVLIRLYEHLRMREKAEQANKAESLSHITVIEEAHRLLKNVMERSPAAHAVELFAGLLAEIRAYREGLVVAEQIPSKILPDVIKNTALKVVHRLPAKDDRDSVGATMNLSDEQSQYVVSLKPGWAAVFTDGMDHPLLALMDNTGEATEKESKKLATRVYGSNVPLCTSRSQACGKICREQRLCTLREINQAARLAEDPQLILWIEMIVVAHLTGMWLPIPQHGWLTELVTYHQRRSIERWKERGLVLVGSSPSELLASLRLQAAYLRPKDAVIHGLVVPSRIEDAVKKNTTGMAQKDQWFERTDRQAQAARGH
jgi:hypothetical protein